MFYVLHFIHLKSWKTKVCMSWLNAGDLVCTTRLLSTLALARSQGVRPRAATVNILYWKRRVSDVRIPNRLPLAWWCFSGCIGELSRSPRAPPLVTPPSFRSRPTALSLSRLALTSFHLCFLPAFPVWAFTMGKAIKVFAVDQDLFWRSLPRSNQKSCDFYTTIVRRDTLQN